MIYLTDDKVKYLEQMANEIRQLVINMLMTAGSGHTAGSLGMADIMTILFFDILKHNPQDPAWPERDRLILSNGHICPVLYATMAKVGYFPITELESLRQFGSRLQGHPQREYLPGLETSSGPLGSGLSQAVGMALADRMDSGRSSDRFFYCLLSDGEIQSGQTFEAMMLAGKEKLHNLIAIVDRNNIQIDGFTEEVMPLEPLTSKFKAFNWQTIVVNGHNFKEINDAIWQAKSIFGQPAVIIANTIPGKGVRDFEWKFEWHGKPPSTKEGKEALKELRTMWGKLKGNE